jgi:hypothetical protein
VAKSFRWLIKNSIICARGYCNHLRKFSPRAQIRARGYINRCPKRTNFLQFLQIFYNFYHFFRSTCAFDAKFYFVHLTQRSQLNVPTLSACGGPPCFTPEIHPLISTRPPYKSCVFCHLSSVLHLQPPSHEPRATYHDLMSTISTELCPASPDVLIF